jgi:hypothetical protein
MKNIREEELGEGKECILKEVDPDFEESIRDNGSG